MTGSLEPHTEVPKVRSSSMDGCMSAGVHARYIFGVVCCRPLMSSDHLDFLFASLHSKRPRTARKVHIRRLYDVLQLSIQRQDFTRARRAWAILARCKEIQWKSLWMTSLLLVGDGLHDVDSSKDKINYLRSLMLRHLDDVRMYLRVYNISLPMLPSAKPSSQSSSIASL